MPFSPPLEPDCATCQWSWPRKAWPIYGPEFELCVDVLQWLPIPPINKSHTYWEQETLAEFIVTGAYERHLRRARRGNALRREVLLDAIQKYLGDRVSVTGDRSGTHIVLWPREREAEEDIIDRAASRGVGIYGIARYFLKASSGVGLMLGYSRMKPEEIREGIRRLASTF
jgi:DNA-binding transcriptional MocR family regulator